MTFSCFDFVCKKCKHYRLKFEVSGGILKRFSIFFSLTFIYLVALFSNSITVTDTPDTLYIGQLINIELDLTDYEPERLFILKDRSSPQIEIFDIQSFRNRPWQYLIRIAAFDTGYIHTDRIPIYYTKENESDTLYIEPFSFFVKSALTFSDTLLKDIAAPRSFKWKFFDYFLPIIVLLLIALGIYLLSRLKKLKEEPEWVDLRPAWMIVYELLEQFKQKNLLAQGLYLDYYFELSLIFRIFIERQFNIKAAEMTTYEIKQSLDNVSEKRDIVRILTDMDKVKFAKFTPNIKDAEDIFYWIEKYVLSFSNSNSDTKTGSQNNKNEDSNTEVNDV